MVVDLTIIKTDVRVKGNIVSKEIKGTFSLSLALASLALPSQPNLAQRGKQN